jgi:hypothetical protein
MDDQVDTKLKYNMIQISNIVVLYETIVFQNRIYHIVNDENIGVGNPAK